MTSTQITALVHEHRAASRDTLEPLPARLRARERLPDRGGALTPPTSATRRPGRRRLAFDELLLLQLALLRRRARRREGARAEPLAPVGALTVRWLSDSLPFAPTDDQRARDGRRSTPTSPSDRPMQRLLMGEVGSGKTVVALLRDAARGRVTAARRR